MLEKRFSFPTLPICMYYFCNSSFFYFLSPQFPAGARSAERGPWSTVTFLLSSSPSSSSLAPQIHKEYQVNLPSKTQIRKTYIEFPSLFSLAPKNQIHKEYQVTLFRYTKYTNHILSFPPCFRWPLRSPFSKTPQIHKTYVEFPSLFSLAPKNKKTQGVPGHPYHRHLKYTRHIEEYTWS